MFYRKLRHTDIKVSAICLGTMTWGEQNTQSQAFEQMDFALAQGINFFDTAELYPVPPNAQTYASTETIIGNWLVKRKSRDKIILASKVAGPGFAYMRTGSNFSKQQLKEALEASLTRLKTDYLDLYQLHWPERHTNYFGQLGFKPTEDDRIQNFKEITETMDGFIKQGKIRSYGISNETPWGFMQYLTQAPSHLRFVSIQNPYNLLNRTFEVGLAEMSYKEKIGLLAYSPMAFGVLSGKYLYGQQPANARLTLFSRYNRRYSGSACERATEQYIKLANEYNISPAQMALRFVIDRPFVTSCIIGATTLEQLKENIESIELDLSDQLLGKIEEIHQSHANPAS